MEKSLSKKICCTQQKYEFGDEVSISYKIEKLSWGQILERTSILVSRTLDFRLQTISKPIKECETE